MASMRPQACDACKAIFVNEEIPSVFIEGRVSGNAIKWCKTAQELEFNISRGCEFCKALREYFESGYLRSKSYGQTGSIKVNITFLPLGTFVVAIYPDEDDIDVVDEFRRHDWLSFKLAAASGMMRFFSNSILVRHLNNFHRRGSLRQGNPWKAFTRLRGL
jgi:hypothetical protein